jgi:serine/threonine protein phosphatase PrpC
MVIIQSTSLQGYRESNEDAEIIFENINNKKKDKNKINIYAVFDGHGGDEVSKYLKKHYLDYFIPTNRPKPTNKKKNYQKYICETYNHIQEKLTLECKDIANTTGTAALAIIHYLENRKNKLYVVNLGDCRAVKCDKKNLAIPLTLDHKPNNYGETNRILNMGGKIIQEPGDDPRIEGLSLSRALGDLDTKPFVSHIPEIFRYELDNRDKFLIVACDGLWDAFENQQAINFVLNELDKTKKIKSDHTSKNNTNIAYLLAEEAIKRGSRDNVSVIIVFFK